MDFLRFLEGIRNPFFDFIFSSLTLFGGEYVFIVAALIVFWCVSKKDGYYILCIGYLGTIVNQFLKIVFRIPRPWILDENFKPVESAVKDAKGYSFPSGHTQTSVGTYGSFAYLYKNKLLRGFCIAICILIPFSRMYLGVHTPIDVLTSFFLGILSIFAFRPIIDYCYGNDKRMNILLAVMFGISFIYLIFINLYNSPSIDETYYADALKNAYSFVGALIGILISYNIETRYVKFETDGKWYFQILKVVFGCALLFGIKSGLKPLFNLIFNGHPIADAFRYGIVVIFAVVVFPKIFMCLKRIIFQK